MPSSKAEHKKNVAAFYDHNFDYWLENDRKSIRLQYLDLLGDVNGQTVIDMGCGTGHDAEIMAARGASGIGVDFSLESIKYASGRNIGGWEFFCNDNEVSSWGEFDILISSMELMYHPELKPAILNYRKHLNPHTGKLLVVVNNPYLISQTYQISYQKRQAYEHVFKGIIAKNLKIHTPLSEFISEFLQAGFHLEQMKEIYCKGKDCAGFQGNAVVGLPDFLAFVFKLGE